MRVIYILTKSDKISSYKAYVKNKSVSFCGIGISNLPLIDFFLEAGARVTARDMKERSALGNVAQDLENKGVRLICGKNYLENMDEDIIFRTPGLRYDNINFVKALKRGAVLTSEMQVFFELCPAHKIAVTGSDGKTTTTTLISEMLKASGKNVFLGGNIGKPLLPEVEKITPDDYAVIELSSFQLHTMTVSPEIAVITNISPNHLDYHKDYAEYIDAKKNIYRHNENLKLITNAENEITKQMANEFSGEKVMFSSLKDNDICASDGYISVNGEKVLKTSDILLPARHNVENYMAAIGAVYGIASIDAIQTVAKTFKGVEHRLEFVATKNGVKYYNSSIDSTPTRTVAALSAFEDKSLIVICGGYDKKLDYSPLCSALAKKAIHVVLTGACAPKIKEALLASEEFISSGTKISEHPIFRDAVIAAARYAHPGDIVLLSPAAASFDSFKNFEVRGRTFKQIVNEEI